MIVPFGYSVKVEKWGGPDLGVFVMDVQLGIEIAKSGQRGLSREVLERGLQRLVPPQGDVWPSIGKSFHQTLLEHYRRFSHRKPMTRSRRARSAR